MADLANDPDFEPLPPEPDAVAGEGPAAAADPDFQALPSIDELNAATDAKVKAVFDIGAANPDRQARVVAVTRQLGIKSNVVDAKLDEFEQAAKAANFDPSKLREQRPELVRLMVGDPEAGAVAVHDQELGKVQELLGRAHDVLRANPEEGRASLSAPMEQARHLAIDQLVKSGTLQPDDPLVTQLEQPGGAPELVKRLGLPPLFEELPPQEQESMIRGRQLAIDLNIPFDRAEREKPKKVAQKQATPEQEALIQDQPLAMASVRYWEAEQSEQLQDASYRLATARSNNAPADDIWQLQKEVEDVRNRTMATHFGSATSFQTATGDLASQAEPLVTMGVETVKGAGAVGGVAAGATALGMLAVGADPETASEAAFTAGKFFGGKGAEANMARGMYRREAGKVYDSLINLKKPDGSPEFEHDEAWGAARLGAAFNTAIQVGALNKMWGGGAPAKVGSATLVELLKDKAFVALAKKAAAAEAGHYFTMGAQGGLSSLLDDATLYFLRSYKAGAFQSAGAPDLERALVAGHESGKTGLVVGPVLTTVHAGLNAATSEVLARAESDVGAKQVAALQALKESPTSKASPKAVAQMITEQTAKSGRPLTDLYVDPKQFVRLFQAEKVDLTTAATNMLGEDGPKQLAEALQTGGKLKVSIEKYVEKWAGSDVGAKLAEHTTTAIEDQTPPELRATTPEIKKQLESLREQADVRNKENETGKQEILKYVRDQAIAAGVGKEEAAAGAELVARSALTFAANTGLGVREAAALAGIGQLRVLGDKGELVAQKTRARFATYLQPEASTLLASKLAAVPPEEQGAYRAREYFIDPVTGLRNERAWKAAERQPGKQIAVITSPDIKGINDHPTAGGHDVANDLLRAIGAEVFKHDPEAARAGTNFYLHVDGEAGFNKALESIRAALPDTNIRIEGEVGATHEKAGKALGDLIDEKRASGELPKRGELPPGLDVAKLAFGPEKATSTVPEALANQLGEMPAHEYARLAYLDRVDLAGPDGKPESTETGLLSAEGYRAIPKKAHQLAIDAKGLKLTNDTYGKPVGNKLLFAIANALKHFGGASFDAAHLSGDEYVAQHDDPLKLREFADRVKAGLDPLEVYNGTTGKREKVAVDFRYGLGRDYAQADRDLNAGKRAEAKARNDLVQGPASGGAGNAGGGVPKELQGGAREASPLGLGVGAPGQSFQERDVARQQGEAYIGRLAPDKRVVAQAFVDWVDGTRPDRPDISDELEKKLATFGIAKDYGFDQYGRSMERPLGGPRRKGESKLSIGEKQAFLAQMRGDAPDYRLKQEPIAYLDGAPLELNAGDPKDPRGTISMRLSEGGEPVEFNIEILKADKSTFLHEIGHFLSQSLAKVATSDLANEATRRDYDTLLKWAGFESHEQRISEGVLARDLGAKETRTPEEQKQLDAIIAKEEKISHGWEQYLAEGKAPTKGLAKLFSRFKGWMVRIYKGLSNVEKQYQARYGQPLALSDDVRKVFDRVLAEDDAINTARERTGQTRPPPSITDGMTPAELAAYNEARANSRLAAEADLAARANELLGGAEKLEKSRAEIAAEVTLEHDRLPVYRASRFLQRGELVDETGKPIPVPDVLVKDGKPLKVDRGAFVKRFDREAARAMPPGMFAEGKGGISIEQLAPLLGYDDASTLVTQLRYSQEREASIAKETNDRMREQYEPALRQLADLALSSVHNDEAARAILLGARNLAKQIDPRAENRVKSIDLALLKEDATRRIGEKSIGEVDPDVYAKTERKIALDAARLRGRGDKAKALEQQEQALHNQVLYRAAEDAQRKVEVIRQKLSNTSDAVRANLGLADPAYRDVHDAVVAALGLGEAPPGKTLDELLKVVDDSGQVFPDYAVDAIRALLDKPKDFDSLSVNEAKDIGDAISSLRLLAKDALEVNVANKTYGKVALLKEIDETTSKARPELPKRSYDPTVDERSLLKKAGSLRRSGQAMLEDVETWAEMMDGGTSGPMHDIFIKSRLEARAKDVELTQRVLRPIMEKWSKLPKEVRAGATKRLPDQVAQWLPPPDPDFAPIYNRGFLYALFLNWGNEGNRQRVRDGNKWTDENVQKALDLLKPEEAKFLQTVLDAENSLWPEVSALHEKQTGLKLEKVQSTPITVNGETFAGGYHPIKYDSRISEVGTRQEITSAKDLAASSIIRPNTAKGHTKSRVERVNEPIAMNWDVVPAHLSQVIQNTAYGEWVRQTAKIVLDKGFKKTVDNYLGSERSELMKPWLADVANARADSTAGQTSKFLRWLGPAARSAVALKVMALNVPALVRHTFDPFTAMADSEAIMPWKIANAYQKVINPGNWNDPIYAGSKEIAYHEAKLTDNLRGELNKIGRGTPWKQRATDVLFKAHAFVDHFTTRVAFRAAYEDAISKGATPEQATTRADQVLARHFPSGELATKPAILRQKGAVAGAVMFWGYAAKMLNLRIRAADAAYRAWNKPGATITDKAEAASTVAAKWLAMSAVSSVGAYFAGRLWKRDEDVKDRGIALATEVVTDPLNDIPIVGPLVKKGVQKVATGSNREIDVANAPELALLEQLINRGTEAIVKASSGQETSKEDRVANIVEFLVSLLGPAAQTQRTASYLRAVNTGETPARGPLDVASGAALGPKAASPLTDAQGVISGR